MSDPSQSRSPRSPAAAAAVSLGTQTAGRDNNVQLLRLLAASAVVVFHCYALTDRWTDEPLWRMAPELNLGALGVKIFFAISGFLVTQSWLQRRHIGAFAAARVVRIYPALVAATLLTILLGAVSSALPFRAFVAHPDTLDFAWQTASGWGAPVALPGAYAHNPFPNAVNGSLWTLPIEIRLYVALGVAGIVGLLAHRIGWMAALAAGIVAGAIVPDAITIPLHGGPGNRPVLELALMFGLGSLAYAWRDAIPLSLGALIAAIALVAWNPWGLARGTLFEPLLAYIVLVLGYHPLLRWTRFNRIGDYSYGVYVYSFPVQQTLVEHLHGISPALLLVTALPITLALGALSWHALERPALRLKSRFRSS